jgi:hypothetical protein
MLCAEVMLFSPLGKVTLSEKPLMTPSLAQPNFLSKDQKNEGLKQLPVEQAT